MERNGLWNGTAADMSEIVEFQIPFLHLLKSVTCILPRVLVLDRHPQPVCFAPAHVDNVERHELQQAVRTAWNNHVHDAEELDLSFTSHPVHGDRHVIGTKVSTLSAPYLPSLKFALRVTSVHCLSVEGF